MPPLRLSFDHPTQSVSMFLFTQWDQRTRANLKLQRWYISGGRPVVIRPALLSFLSMPAPNKWPAAGKPLTCHLALCLLLVSVRLHVCLLHPLSELFSPLPCSHCTVSSSALVLMDTGKLNTSCHQMEDLVGQALQKLQEKEIDRKTETWGRNVTTEADSCRRLRECK